jgi:hypothetical protein
MAKESKLQDLMPPFWQALADANDELNAFINGGLPSTTEKRHKVFVRKFDNMKDKAVVLCDQIEKEVELSIEPVEIVLPWMSDAFQEAWKAWKDYLAEQHHKTMKSRMEYAALAYLKRIADGKEATAIEYLKFAMANGYPRFFKVTTKSYEQPTIAAGGRGDGDY